MLIYTVKQGTSKQSWLGSVDMCPCCESQQPKSEFKHINGEDVCAKCQQEQAD